VTVEAKQISWRWCTIDQILSPGPCWLIWAYLVVSAASADTHLYNGLNPTADKVVTLESADVTGHEFTPPQPLYCSKGLYIDVGAAVTGVLVAWESEEVG
jgi:hypothetical protein